MLGGATGLREIAGEIDMAVTPTPMHFRDCHMSGADGTRVATPDQFDFIAEIRSNCRRDSPALRRASGKTSGITSC
jgi:hypothetical protein